MKKKQVMFAIILIFLIGVFYVIQSEKINVVLTPFKTDSIEEINKNPKGFENQSVKVSGTFYRIIGKHIFDENCNLITTLDFKIVDSQGIQLFINAPSRELINYDNRRVTIEGIIKIGGYDNCACNFFKCNLQHYLELSKIS